jgi:hypothetical protein
LIKTKREEHLKVKQKDRRKRRCENQVKIEFTDKPITAWGGIAGVISRYLHKISFKEWVESSIPIQETSNNGKGIYEKVLALFLTVMVGGQRFSHLSWWGHGVEAIYAGFGVKWLPLAVSTVTRFWSRINSQALSEIIGERCRQFVSQILAWEGITKDNLNLDSSVITRYGEQEGAKKGYNPKKRGRPSHHPLIAFTGSGHVVNLWNRSGNTHTAQSCVDFFAQTVLSLGSFSINRVLCDSGFYDIDFIKHLESKKYSYIISVRIIEILQHKSIHDVVFKKIDDGLEVGEFYFQHKNKKWDKERRYIVIRQTVSRRPKATGKQLRLFEEYSDYRYSLMITNDEESSPEEIWREYRPRANDENTIKNLKDGYGLAAFNFNNFWATESFMMINAMVFHNLVHYLNRNILNKNSPKEQLKTLRSKWFIIPAQLGSGSGVTILRISVRNPKIRLKLQEFLDQISAISHSLNCIAFETAS